MPALSADEQDQQLQRATHCCTCKKVGVHIRLWVVCKLDSALTSDERDLCNNHHFRRLFVTSNEMMTQISTTHESSSLNSQTLPIINVFSSSSIKSGFLDSKGKDSKDGLRPNAGWKLTPPTKIQTRTNLAHLTQNARSRRTTRQKMTNITHEDTETHTQTHTPKNIHDSKTLRHMPKCWRPNQTMGGVQT